MLKPPTVRVGALANPPAAGRRRALTHNRRFHPGHRGRPAQNWSACRARCQHGPAANWRALPQALDGPAGPAWDELVVTNALESLAHAVAAQGLRVQRSLRLLVAFVVQRGTPGLRLESALWVVKHRLFARRNASLADEA